MYITSFNVAHPIHLKKGPLLVHHKDYSSSSVKLIKFGTRRVTSMLCMSRNYAIYT